MYSLMKYRIDESAWEDVCLKALDPEACTRDGVQVP